MARLRNLSSMNDAPSAVDVGIVVEDVIPDDALVLLEVGERVYKIPYAALRDAIVAAVPVTP